MIKQTWEISNEERNRILSLHESATKNHYLMSEQYGDPKLMHAQESGEDTWRLCSYTIIKKGTDYYIQTDLVIIYYDNKGALSSITTNRQIEKRYIIYIQNEDSDDDQETQHKKWREELNRCIEQNSYKKILYNDDKWIQDSYEKKYSNELKKMSPRINKLVKIYKDYTAWKSE